MVKRFVLFLLVIVVALLVWGVAVEPRLIDTETYVVEVPGLPEEWEGHTVALIADWQLGMWLDNDGTVRRIVEELVEQDPSAVFVAGDFLYPTGGEDDELIAQAADIISPLPEAGIPTLAVLGDHDYAPPEEPNPEVAAALTAALEEVGVEVLHNEAVPLVVVPDEDVDDAAPTGTAEDLYLVGIAPLIMNQTDVDAALAEVPDGAPHLALMHNPDIFQRFPANSASLAMAGHTHGGQIRIPGLPEWSWMALMQEGEVTADGWIDDYGAAGNRLYVNRGIGFSKVPIRIFCPPELTLFTLVQAD